MRILRATVFGLFLIAGAVIGVFAVKQGVVALGQRLNWMPGVIESLEGVGAVTAYAVFCACLFGMLGLALLSLLDRTIQRWSTMSTAERVTFFAAMLVGVGVSIPFHMILFAFLPWGPPVGLILMVMLILISHAMISSMDEALPWSRLGGRKSNWKIFDTNVIIDGRIYDVAKSGFLEGRLYIPQFVVQELQAIADSSEANKRQRGRRGLDLLKNLRHDFAIEVGIHDRYAGDAKEPVDNRLVKLASALGGSLVTNDFNLNKVAKVHGIRVLNVNDLAVASRLHYVPGESFIVEIEREGSQPGQGVGFLEDGTMVVVDHGAAKIGERAEVRITQIHQSSAGKMIFASLNGHEPSEIPDPSAKRQ